MGIVLSFKNLDKLNPFFNQLKDHPSMLMLDYDGTLAPFQIDREKAFPYPGVEERLNKLRNTYLISGRSVKDFDKLLNTVLPIWGSHGLEKKENGLYFQEKIDDQTQEAIEEAKRLCKGEFCEHKPFGLALHWRGRENLEDHFRPLLEKIVKKGKLELHLFDGGIELRPTGRNKGDVVKELIQNAEPNAMIAYLGDDQTDEDAFRALGSLGLKVLVRKEWRESLADTLIVPPDELLAFLDKWIEAT